MPMSTCHTCMTLFPDLTVGYEHDCPTCRAAVTATQALQEEHEDEMDCLQRKEREEAEEKVKEIRADLRKALKGEEDELYTCAGSDGAPHRTLDLIADIFRIVDGIVQAEVIPR